MMSENENPQNEQNPTGNPNASNPSSKEDSMSILERRLAEINARKTGTANTGTPPPASQPANATPETSRSETGSEIKTEKPETLAQPKTPETLSTAAVSPQETLTPAAAAPAIPVTPGPITPSIHPPHEGQPITTDTPVTSASTDFDEISTSPTTDHGPDSGDIISGAVAFHEVLPPTEPGGTTIQPKVTETPENRTSAESTFSAPNASVSETDSTSFDRTETVTTAAPEIRETTAN